MNDKIAVLFGQSTYDANRARMIGQVGAGKPLVEFQREEYEAGFMGAKLVLSMYGWDVRADSSLSDPDLIACSRTGDVDGSWDAAVDAAAQWQAADPTRRYVWVWKAHVPEGCTV